MIKFKLEFSATELIHGDVKPIIFTYVCDNMEVLHDYIDDILDYQTPAIDELVNKAFISDDVTYLLALERITAI